VQAIVALKGEGSLKAIATKAGLDDNTVQRAIEVLVRPVIRETASGPRTVRNPILWKLAGRGGKPSRYGVFWGELQRLARDERLALFAGRLASGELDPVAGDLTPVEPPLNPVARKKGEGGDFLGASQEQENPSSPSYLLEARHGGEVASHGGELERAEFDREFQQAGVNSPDYRRQYFDQARERCWTRSQVAELLAFYHEHSAAWMSAGVLGLAIRNGPPEGEWWSIFPPAKTGYVADRSERAARADRRIENDREAERGLIIARTRKLAKQLGLDRDTTVAKINEVLRNRGHEEIATSLFTAAGGGSLPTAGAQGEPPP
jgi:hypothetical protein